MFEIGLFVKFVFGNVKAPENTGNVQEGGSYLKAKYSGLRVSWADTGLSAFPCELLLPLLAHTEWASVHSRPPIPFLFGSWQLLG